MIISRTISQLSFSVKLAKSGADIPSGDLPVNLDAFNFDSTLGHT